MLRVKSLSAEAFAQKRRRLGMTQLELAEELGLEVRQVKRYENETYKPDDAERVPRSIRLALALLLFRRRILAQKKKARR